jgi:hypothetical protein
MNFVLQLLKFLKYLPQILAVIKESVGIIQDIKAQMPPKPESPISVVKPAPTPAPTPTQKLIIAHQVIQQHIDKPMAVINTVVASDTFKKIERPKDYGAETPGTVSINKGARDITGLNTKFLNTFKNGDTIGVENNGSAKITIVIHDTLIIANEPFFNTASELGYYKK